MFGWNTMSRWSDEGTGFICVSGDGKLQWHLVGRRRNAGLEGKHGLGETRGRRSRGGGMSELCPLLKWQRIKTHTGLVLKTKKSLHLRLLSLSRRILISATVRKGSGELSASKPGANIMTNWLLWVDFLVRLIEWNQLDLTFMKTFMMENDTWYKRLERFNRSSARL